MSVAATSNISRWRMMIWFASAVLIVVLAAGIAFGLYVDRYLTITAASDSAEQSAALTSSLVDGIVRDINAIVVGLQVAQTAHPRGFAASVAAKADWIRRELEQREAVRAYAIIDHDGTVIAANLRNLINQNTGDRPYFAVHRDGLVPGLFVTDPFISTVTGYRLFLVSWPLRAADGALLGVLAISFDTDVIESIIGAMTRPQDDTAALMKSNGNLLATSRREDIQSIDADYTDAGLRALLDDPTLAGKAEVRDATIFGHHSRWISVVRPLPSLDAAIVVARDLDIILTTWRWRAIAAATVGALLVVSTLACAMTLTRLVRRQQNALIAAEEAALTDPLTGVFNRRMFHTWATTEWSRAQRQGTQLSLLLLDIDHFKRINDRFGHATGDEVLVELASCLRSLIRNEDLIARMGGEEFAIVMPNLSLADAPRLADRLRGKVEKQRFTSDAATIAVTVSIGVAEVHACQRPIETALSAADMALYRAKRQGRNRVVVATAGDQMPAAKKEPFTVVRGGKAAS